MAKALVYTASRTLEVIEVKMPSAGKGQALLKVLACCVCGSDVHGYFGENGRRTAPMVMGHEFSARVEALGESCEGLAVGDIVSVQPCLSCFECDFCKSGHTQRCEKKTFLGVLATNGAFQEYITIPAKHCMPLPKGMDYKAGALVEPFAVSYSAVKKAGNLDGKSVLIIGGGTIGLLALVACKMRSKFAKVFVSDLSSSRLEYAKKFGADGVVTPSEVAAGSFDVSIEAVGIEATARLAMSALRPGGVSVWIGNNHRDVKINMQEIVTRELNVHGSYVFTHEEFAQSIEAISKSDMDLVGMFISRELSLEEAPQVFAEMAKDIEKYLKCLIVM